MIKGRSFFCGYQSLLPEAVRSDLKDAGVAVEIEHCDIIFYQLFGGGVLGVEQILLGVEYVACVRPVVAEQ